MKFNRQLRQSLAAILAVLITVMSAPSAVADDLLPPARAIANAVKQTVSGALSSITQQPSALTLGAGMRRAKHHRTLLAAAPAKPGLPLVPPSMAPTNGAHMQSMPPVSPNQAMQAILSRQTPANLLIPPVTGAKRQSALRAKVADRRTAMVGNSADNTVPGPDSIAELARALKNNPDLIYQYVANNIDYYPTFGVQRGALGTLIDGVGNDFDQSMLMYELLTQAGFSPQYQLGVIQLTAAQAANLFDIDTSNANTAAVLIGNGGIPANVVANTDGSLNYVQIEHMWVQVNIGGTWYAFDPAFKTYSYTSGIDIGSATGYNAGTFLSQAESGATISSDSTQNLDSTNIRSQLTSYATNLVSWIKTNQPAATVSDIIGGKSITPVTGRIRQTSLPYLASGYPVDSYTDGTLPTSLYATLEIAYQGFDVTATSSYVYGHRLTIFYDSSNQPTLYYDGTAVPGATGSPVNVNQYNPITLTVKHPYASTAANQKATQFPYSTNPFFIGSSYGTSSRQMVEYHRKALLQNSAAGDASDSEPVFGESLAVEWYTHNSQLGLEASIIDGMSRCTTAFHHVFGLSENFGAPVFDIPGATVLTSSHNENDATISVQQCFTNIMMHASALEAAAHQQMQGLNAVCTPKVLDAANTQGIAIFEANSTNWSTIEPQLVNYPPDELTSIENLVNAPNLYSVILPQNGSITIDSWTNNGYYAVRGAPNLAVSSVLGFEQFSGGEVTTEEFDPIIDSGDGGNQPKNKQPGPTSSEPIDFSSGDYLYSHNDLTVGSGAFPYSLNFTRFYSSGNTFQNGPLGLGWTHNFAITALPNSDGYQAMGEESPIDAAAVIAEMFVTNDLLSDSTQPLDKLMVATISHKWYIDQITNNTVIVTSPQMVRPFVKLADGSFNPPRGDAGTLVQNGDGTFTYTSPQQIAFHFNSNGQLSSEVDPAGTTVSLSYNGSGQLQTVSNNTGRSLTLSYTNGLLTGVSDGTRSVAYSFDSNDDLTQFTDANSQNITYSYQTGSPGLLTQYFLPANPSIAFTTNVYDSLGRVATQSDALGNTWTYYLAGSRAEEVDPAGHSHILYMDAVGDVLRDINALGQETDSVFDGLYRLTSVTLPEGNGSSFTYDSKNNILTATANPQPGSGQSAITNSFTWDPTYNKVATTTDALSNTTTFSYDSATGNLLSIQRPQVNGQTPTISYTHNSRGQVATITDPTGIVTQFNYSNTNETLTSVVEDYGASPHLNLTTSFAFDAIGNPTSVTDANGNTTQSVFDNLRRLTQTTSAAPFNFVTNMAYDANSNVTSVQRQTSDPNNPWQTTTYAYSPANLLLTMTDPLSHVSSLFYDNLRRLIKSTDAQGNSTLYNFDPLSRVASVIGPAGEVNVTNSYSPNGNLTQVQDANGHATAYSFDGLDRLAKTTYADGSFEQLSYDNDGNILTAQTRANKQIAFTYDSLNRVVTKAPQSQPSVTFGYDLANRMLSASTPAVSGDPSTGTFQLGYDSAGRLMQSTTPDSLTVQYSLDPVGNMTKLTWPDGYFAQYQYDQLNRLSAISLNGAAMPAVQYQYDALSRRTGTRNGNGTSSSYAYNLDDTLASLSLAFNQTAAKFAYQYNNVGQRTNQVLTGTNLPLIWQPSSGNVGGYQSNAVNEYTTAGGTASSYDANGNLATLGSETFTFDTENHLLSFVNGSNPAVTYEYDPLGRQTLKSAGSLRFLYDLDTRQIADFDSSTNTLQTRHVFGLGLDEPLLDIDATTAAITYLHEDPTSSVIATTNATGAITNSYAYSPFGESGPLSGTVFAFAGQRYDAESVLHYLRARYYAPSLGRFLQTDPLGSDVANNLYTYASSNPLQLSDPMGLSDSTDNAQLAESIMLRAACIDAWQRANRFGNALVKPRPFMLGPIGTWLAQTPTEARQNENVLVGLSLGSGPLTSGILGLAGTQVVVGAGTAIVVENATTAQSVWSLSPIQRGVQIEEMLGGGELGNFPVIDKYENGVATSIKSIDLSAASYQVASRLQSTVNGYINKLANFQGNMTWGIHSVGNVATRELELAIPPGGSAAQSQAIQSAIQYGQSKGVTVIPIVIH